MCMKVLLSVPAFVILCWPDLCMYDYNHHIINIDCDILYNCITVLPHCCSDASYCRIHNMHRLERIELNYSCMTQVTETLQLQTEQASEIVKSPMMQRAMLLDSSLSCDILKYSRFLLFGRWIPLASVREENDTKVIHSCLRKSVSTRLPLSISASGPQARKELIDPMLRAGSLPLSPCYSAQVVIWKLEDHIQSSISHLIAAWTVLRKWADQDRISVLISILHEKGEQTSSNSRQQQLPSTYSLYDVATKGCMHS